MQLYINPCDPPPLNITHIIQNGVATFVQETVVQGDNGPRGQMYKGQLSKEILVRGDVCPRKFLPLISLLKLFFLFSIGYYNID